MAKLPSWLYASDLKRSWDINDFELAEYVLHYGLLAYECNMEPVNIEEEIDYLRNQPNHMKGLVLTLPERIDNWLDSPCIFKEEEAIRFAKKNNLPSPRKEETGPENEGGKTADRRPAEQEERVFHCKPGTKWEDITMSLVADDMLEIRTPQGEGRFTYHDLGMKDIRKGDQPTMLWELVRLFAKENGFISSQNPKYDPKLPDTAKRLNRHLKEFFGIDESIYTGHYKQEKGYRTKIKFYDRTF